MHRPRTASEGAAARDPPRPRAGGRAPLSCWARSCFYVVCGTATALLLLQLRPQPPPAEQPSQPAGEGDRLLSRSWTKGEEVVGCIDATVTLPDEAGLGGGKDIDQLVSEVETEREAEGRSSDRPVVVLTYNACHGALSQHYGHLSALVIAKRIAADVVLLPHPRTRATFKSRNLLGSEDVNKTNAWEETHLEYAYDVASFADYFRSSELRTRVRTFPDKPRAVELPGSFQEYSTHHVKDLHERLNIPIETPHLKLKYKRRRASWVWKLMIERLVERQRQSRFVVVDLGCTDIMVGGNIAKGATREDVAELAAAHRTLRLAPHLVAAADEAVRNMRQVHPRGLYAGLHFRLERDMFTDRNAVRWAQAYQRAKAAFLDKYPMPLLVASGIFEYLSAEELADGQMLGPYYATHRLYRVCLDKQLPNDVRPWVDFLALTRATVFQGHEYSSMAWLVVQQRSLDGRPLDTSALIRKKKAPATPQCCEGDRCLVPECRETAGGPLVNVLPDVTYDPHALPPVVLTV